MSFISITDLSFSLSHKTCFADFSCQVAPGSRIAVVGRNGSGKSTLLAILAGQRAATTGSVRHSPDLVMGYVPQHLDASTVSGGEQLMQAISATLRCQPDVLLLDEPTNHLDQRNRGILIR